MDETGPCRRVFCLFCFSDVMMLKYDRKGRGYLHCAACNTMVFPRMGDVSIVGYKLAAAALQPYAAMLLKKFAEYRTAIMDGKFGAAQQQSLTSTPLPVAAPAEVHHAAG